MPSTMEVRKGCWEVTLIRGRAACQKDWDMVEVFLGVLWENGWFEGSDGEMML